MHIIKMYKWLRTIAGKSAADLKKGETQMEALVIMLILTNVIVFTWLYKEKKRYRHWFKNMDARLNELESTGFTDFHEVLEMHDQLQKALKKLGERT